MKHGNPRQYVIGFVVSLACSLIAYQLVVDGILHGMALALSLALLALIQFVTQAICFLHLGGERWRLTVFIGMLAIVIIIIGGSIWIMSNLDGHMMNQSDITKYVHSQDGL